MHWARDHAPAVHYRAAQPEFLAALAGVMVAAGRPARPGGASLGFTLSVEPGPPGLPGGFRLEERGRDWMSTTAGVLKEFDNALGGNDENDLPIAALVLVDADGSDAAVAGFWGHSHGRCEIGLDVARRFRGRGLAVPVTNAATRWILERGETPEYTCSVTNVRSQRVASSCGYLPAWSWAGVVTEPRPAAIPAG